MDKILIGNSVTLYKKVYDKDGNEINLSSLKSIKLYLIYYATKKVINTQIADNNQLQININTNDIRQTGTYYYVVSLKDNNDNVITSEKEILFEAVLKEPTDINANSGIIIGVNTDYASKMYVDTAISKLEIGDIDLDKYVEKTDFNTLDSKVNQNISNINTLTDNKSDKVFYEYDIINYATNSSVSNAITGLAGDVLPELEKKVNKVDGKGLSTNDYTTAEKNKLSSIESGAQVNTITSVNNKTGAVTISKSDIGLENVSNTSDAAKPISTATQTALNLKADSNNVYTKSEVDSKISNIDISGVDIDLSDFYTKDETENLITENLTNYTNKEEFQMVIDRLSNYQGAIVQNHYVAGFSQDIESFKNKSISFYLERGETANQMVLSNVSASAGFRVTINASNQLVVYYNGVYIIDNAFTSGYLTFTFDNECTLNVYLNGVLTITRPYLESSWKPDWLLGIGIKATEPNLSYIRNFRTFNYTLVQSDVDMLYNQGRSGDVVLDEGLKKTFTGINTNKTYVPYTSENWITPNKVELTFLTATRALVFYSQNKFKGGIYIFKGNIKGSNGEFPTSFAAAEQTTAKYKILQSSYDNSTGDFYFRFLNTDDGGWFFHQLGNMSTIVGDTVIIEFETQYINVLSEFTPESITSTEWFNTGTQTDNIIFNEPSFTTTNPITERYWQLASATKPVPVAIGQKLYTTDTGLIFESAAKPNTRQFLISDWKQLN